MKVLWISPTPSHPVTAGNRAHIFNTAKKFKSAGYDLTLLWYAQERTTDVGLEQMKSFWDKFIMVNHKQTNRKKSKVKHWGIDDWYNDDINSAIKFLISQHNYDVVVCEYVFFSKALTLFPASTFKILSCHDRMSGRAEMLQAIGIAPDFFYTTFDQERIGLSRADLVLSIQDEETEFFKKIASAPVLTLPYYIEPISYKNVNHKGKIRVGYLGSNNSLNRKSINEFINYYEKDNFLKSSTTLVFAGSICDAVNDERYVKIGFVEEEIEFYNEVDIVINPMLDGTGLKIKTVSAIQYGVPFLSTIAGSVGINTSTRAHLCTGIDDLVKQLKVLVKGGRASIHRLKETSDDIKIKYVQNYDDSFKKLANVIKYKSAFTVRDKRVLLVTDVPFWEPGVGSHSRISSLCTHLMQKFKLTVFFLGSIWPKREAEIKNAGFSGIIKSYKDYEKDASNKKTHKKFSNPDSLRFRQHDIFTTSLNVFLNKTAHFDVVIYQYIWLAYMIDALEYKPLTMLDLHDLMSYRQYRFNYLGERHHINISLKEEISILESFDFVLAIQQQECEIISQNVVRTIPLCVPHAVHAKKLSDKQKHKSESLRLLFVGGRSTANKHAIMWFLEQVFFAIKSLDIEVHIAGTVCLDVNFQHPKVIKHGLVHDLTAIYDNADVSINPIMHGGGIKIKSIEAISFGLPLITTLEGAVGINNPDDSGLIVCNSRTDFINSILMFYRDRALLNSYSSKALHAASQQFSFDTAFSQIDMVIESAGGVCA